MFAVTSVCWSVSCAYRRTIPPSNNKLVLECRPAPCFLRFYCLLCLEFSVFILPFTLRSLQRTLVSGSFFSFFNMFRPGVHTVTWILFFVLFACLLACNRYSYGTEYHSSASPIPAHTGLPCAMSRKSWYFPFEMDLIYCRFSGHRPDFWGTSYAKK